MKKSVSFIIAVLLCVYTYAQTLSPFVRVGSTQLSMDQTIVKINTILKKGGFELLGNYNPCNRKAYKVIVFTRKDIKNTVVNVSDRGALAAAFKIGLVQNDTSIVVSYTNPEYILRAYLGKDFEKSVKLFDKFHKDLKDNLRVFGKDFTPFGGNVPIESLADYRYKVSMPRFSDPIELADYNNFYIMYNHIIKNLHTNDYGAKLVYKIVYPDKKIAVIGIALLGEWTESEVYFLDKIGSQNLAALPYEIILQDHKVTMLHGKYRFALFWPNLSLGSFMKIMSTPRHIKKTFKKITSYSPEGL